MRAATLDRRRDNNGHRRLSELCQGIKQYPTYANMYYREGVAQELPRERFSRSVVLPITHLGARRPLAGVRGYYVTTALKVLAGNV